MGIAVILAEPISEIGCAVLCSAAEPRRGGARYPIPFLLKFPRLHSPFSGRSQFSPRGSIPSGASAEPGRARRGTHSPGGRSGGRSARR